MGRHRLCHRSRSRLLDILISILYVVAGDGDFFLEGEGFGATVNLTFSGEVVTYSLWCVRVYLLHGAPVDGVAEYVAVDLFDHDLVATVWAGYNDHFYTSRLKSRQCESLPRVRCGTDVDVAVDEFDISLVTNATGGGRP